MTDIAYLRPREWLVIWGISAALAGIAGLGVFVLYRLW